jgi:CubicO group peptidase (beta-lactamase class C family)
LRQIAIALALAAAAPLCADTVDDYVRAELKARRIPAVAVAVIQDGRAVKQQAYGLASLELNVPARAETVFLLASLTKVFTAAAVLSLVDEGKLSLDDSIAKILPDLPPSWAPVTIRHCLSHTSGLPDLVNSDEKMIAFAEDEAMKKLSDLPAQKPGDKAAYNQTGYMLLGRIIHKLTGTGFEEFILHRIARRLEMANTSYGDARDVVAGRASMYSIFEPSPDRIWMLLGKNGPVRSDQPNAVGAYVYPRYTFTGAGLNSTIVDMAKWEVALDSGRVLKPGTLAQAAKPFRLNDGKDGLYGLGWQIGAQNGHRTMFFGGGAATFHLRLPDDRLSVIVLSNLQGSAPHTLAMDIASLYLPALKQKPK